VHVSVWAWVALLVVTPVLLALDLFVLPRGLDVVEPRTARVWTIVWTLVGLSFTGVVWLLSGEHYANKYATGFLVEKGLTVDQVLVFALVVSNFAAPRKAAARTIFVALWVGLLLKVPFILFGTAIARGGTGELHWAIGILFLVGGAIFLRSRTRLPGDEQNWFATRVLASDSVVERWDDDRFVSSDGGRRVYTLAFAMLVVLVSTDFYFAATVPLAFAVKKPGFLVLASSALAMLGIRSLYWWVVSLEVDRVKLRIALAIVLWLVGLELILFPYAHEPSWVLPLALIVTIAWPLVSARRRRDGQTSSLRLR
jgi:tellurite resistance protein TerC